MRSFLIQANRNKRTCRVEGGRLYAPDFAEFISAQMLHIVLESNFDGHVRTSVNLRRTHTKSGCLHIGCCDFSKANTAKLRKWAREEN